MDIHQKIQKYERKNRSSQAAAIVNCPWVTELCTFQQKTSHYPPRSCSIVIGQIRRRKSINCRKNKQEYVCPDETKLGKKARNPRQKKKYRLGFFFPLNFFFVLGVFLLDRYPVHKLRRRSIGSRHFVKRNGQTCKVFRETSNYCPRGIADRSCPRTRLHIVTVYVLVGILRPSRRQICILRILRILGN